MMNEKDIQAYNEYMKFKREISAVGEIMDAVEQTDEWMRAQQTDPGIHAADKAFTDFVAGLDLSSDEAEKACDMAMALANAYVTPAILYGMNVAFSLQAVAANPAVLTAIIQKRREEHEE